MPTVHDVARRAGVAPITVSRVVNNSGYVSQEVRLRVEGAIAELGYVPNGLARGLRSRRSQTLALVLTDIANPFFTLAARGVEDAASDAGFTVIYCNTDESEDEERRYLQVLRQKQVDGILLVPAGRSVRALAGEINVPLVLMDRRLPGLETDLVRCDSEGGAYLLTRHLLQAGHRQIAMLTGPQGVSTAEDRLAGWRRAYTEAGLTPPELASYGTFTQESGSQQTRQALAAGPRPTAIFAANNFLAIGAWKTLRAAGLQVPEDISLVAFDDLPEALIVDPFLTVAAQPAYAMGRQAAELLLGRLSGAVDGPCQEIVLPAELIVRRSTRPI